MRGDYIFTNQSESLRCTSNNYCAPSVYLLYYIVKQLVSKHHRQVGKRPTPLNSQLLQKVVNISLNDVSLYITGTFRILNTEYLHFKASGSEPILLWQVSQLQTRMPVYHRDTWPFEFQPLDIADLIRLYKFGEGEFENCDESFHRSSLELCF